MINISYILVFSFSLLRSRNIGLVMVGMQLNYLHIFTNSYEMQEILRQY